MNKALLLGRLGKDPETKEINGNQVTKFSLATTEKVKDKSGETKELTEWHNIVIWGKLADVAQKYLTKGSQVLVEGKMSYKSWEDKDGNKKYMTEINCTNFQMLGGKQEIESKSERKTAADNIAKEVQNEAVPFNDDLPF